MINEIIDSRYQIISKLGTGSTSVVYKAKRMSDGEIVAIKIMREEFVDNDECIDRFLRESQALSKLSHPNIRNVLDLGQTDGAYYIVTEYVDGDTLKDIIKREKVLPLSEVIDYALQITAGLAHAHENNIIHRDIKPQNMLVSLNGTLKVADFGIARVLSQNTLTMAGQDVVGSVHYISPEQARGSHIDARSDIYSVGVVLYEMATGELPFSGNEPVTVAMKHINQYPRKPKDINHDIPQGLNDIILKCMAKDPNSRYQNVDALRDDLMQLAANPETFAVGAAAVASAAKENKADNVTEEQDEEAVSDKPARIRRVEQKMVKKARSKKQIMLIGGIIGAIIALIVLMVVIFTPKDGVTPSGKVAVPDVIGLSESDAQKKLKDSSLRVGESLVEYSLTIPKGCVTKQDPAANTELAVRDVVVLTISNGPKPCTIPQLINLTEEQAKLALEAVGLKLGTVHEEKTNAKAADRVYEQQYKYNSLQAEGTTVDIWVARAVIVEKRVVPDLTGMTQEAATELISSKGFLVGGVHLEYSTFSPGVYQQNPAAGTEYGPDENISITIWVSKGIENLYSGSITFEIPDSISANSTMEIVYVDAENTEHIVNQADSINPGAPPITISYNSNIKDEQRLYYLKINGQIVDSKTMICSEPVVQSSATPAITPTPTPNP